MSSSTFDALDFFHAQQSQQKYQLARLDEAKNALDQARNRLELVEADFAQKKRLHAEVLKRKQALASHTMLADQVNLLANRADLICSVERKTLDRVKEMERELSVAFPVKDEQQQQQQPEEETSNLLETAEKMIRDMLHEFAKFELEIKALDLELETLVARNKLLEEENAATQRRLLESNNRGNDIRKQVQYVQHAIAEAEKERDLVLEHQTRLCQELFKQNMDEHADRKRELDVKTLEIEALAEKQLQVEAQCADLEAKIKHLEDEIAVVKDIELTHLQLELSKCATRDEEQARRFQLLQHSVETKRNAVEAARKTVKPIDVLWEEQRASRRDASFNQMVMESVEPLKSRAFDMRLKVKELNQANEESKDDLEALKQSFAEELKAMEEK